MRRRIAAVRCKGRPGLCRAGAVLGILALLLQATALLAHFAIRPHTHDLALLTAADGALPTAHHHSGADHAHRHHHAPAPKPPDCPVWTALHLLGGCTPPASAVLLEEPWPIRPAFHPIAAPVSIPWIVTDAQPRAPPVTG